MKPNLRAIISILACALFLAPAAFAQSTGGLSGTISDTNGAVVQGANIIVTNTATNLIRNTTTNDEGRWTVTLLPVGSYSVSYEKGGFKKAINERVEVEASVSRTVDVTLEVGASDVFVDVTSDQPLVRLRPQPSLDK